MWVSLGRCESFRQATVHIFSCFQLPSYIRPRRPLRRSIAAVFHWKGLMSSRPGCFGHLHQGCQPGSQHFLHGHFFPKSFRRRSVQGRGNSGILQVKQCSVSRMTLCGASLLIHSALPRLSGEIPPRAWG